MGPSLAGFGIWVAIVHQVRTADNFDHTARESDETQSMLWREADPCSETSSHEDLNPLAKPS
jgi:hypothetical protein